MQAGAAARRGPSVAAINLISCCLATPQDPRPEAWRTLAADPAVLRDPDVRRAGLMPQLLHAADQARIELDSELRSAWRAARVHEDLRLPRLLPACQEALSVPEEQIVLRGVALSHTIYAEPALRHCHDLDLLVPGPSGTTVHHSGFPVSRHGSLFSGASVPVRFDEARRDAVAAEVAGTPALVLDPVDTLLHISVHAARLRSPHDPLWCIDAALVLRRHPDLDWARLEERAAEWDLAAVAWHQLHLLRSELDLPVPPETLVRLRPRRSWRRRARSLVRRLVPAPPR